MRSQVAAAQDVCIVLSTAPVAEAAALGRRLLEARLIACVNLLGSCQSMYRWKGEVVSEAEVLMVMKTTQARLEELGDRLRAWHSYELPEMLVFAADTGLAAYLSWVAGEVGGGG